MKYALLIFLAICIAIGGIVIYMRTHKLEGKYEYGVAVADKFKEDIIAVAEHRSDISDTLSDRAVELCYAYGFQNGMKVYRFPATLRIVEYIAKSINAKLEGNIRVDPMSRNIFVDSYEVELKRWASVCVKIYEDENVVEYQDSTGVRRPFLKNEHEGGRDIVTKIGPPDLEFHFEWLNPDDLRNGTVFYRPGDGSHKGYTLIHSKLNGMGYLIIR